jgi:hypothetical protein
LSSLAASVEIPMAIGGDALLFLQEVTSNLKHAFGNQLGEFEASLEAKFGTLTQRLGDDQAALETLEKKCTQAMVLQSADIAILGTGNVICVMCTANLAALRRKT